MTIDLSAEQSLINTSIASLREEHAKNGQILVELPLAPFSDLQSLSLASLEAIVNGLSQSESKVDGLKRLKEFKTDHRYALDAAEILFRLESVAKKYRELENDAVFQAWKKDQVLENVSLKDWNQYSLAVAARPAQSVLSSSSQSSESEKPKAPSRFFSFLRSLRDAVKEAFSAIKGFFQDLFSNSPYTKRGIESNVREAESLPSRINYSLSDLERDPGMVIQNIQRMIRREEIRTKDAANVGMVPERDAALAALKVHEGVIRQMQRVKGAMDSLATRKEDVGSSQEIFGPDDEELEIDAPGARRELNVLREELDQLQTAVNKLDDGLPLKSTANEFIAHAEARRQALISFFKIESSDLLAQSVFAQPKSPSNQGGPGSVPPAPSGPAPG